MDEHRSSSVDDGWVELLDALPSSPPAPQSTSRAAVIGPPPKMKSVPERPRTPPAWIIPLPRPGGLPMASPAAEPPPVDATVELEPASPAEDVPIGQSDAVTVPEPVHAADEPEVQAARSGEIEVDDEPAANSKPHAMVDSDDDLDLVSQSRESMTIPGFAAAYRADDDADEEIGAQRRPMRVAAMVGGLAIAFTVVGVSAMGPSASNDATAPVAAASLPSVGTTPEPAASVAKPIDAAPTPPTPQARADASPAEALLDEARSHLQAGDAAAAYVAARDSHRAERSVDALLLMGKSACEMRSRHKVEFVLRMLRPADRRSIVALCERKGLTLDQAPTPDSDDALDIIE